MVGLCKVVPSLRLPRRVPHVSQKTRDVGHAGFVVMPADSRFPSASLRAGSHRAFSPVRNDKALLELAAGQKSCPSRPPLPKSPEGWGVESHPSAPQRAGSFANDARPFDSAQGRIWGTPAYNNHMRQPIRVDNSRPATPFDTARILGVSKKRTEAIVRAVRRMIQRDAKTGEIVIRTNGRGKTAGNHNSRNVTKTRKTTSARRKTSR